jgi:hypothetical protein
LANVNEDGSDDVNNNDDDDDDDDARVSNGAVLLSGMSKK